MRTIFSICLAALAASTSAVSGETTIAILEFGPGGSVHRTTSASIESSQAAVASFWNVLHRPTSSLSKRSSSMGQYAGMSVVPDLFTTADAGIIVGLSAESLESMPTAASLLSDYANTNKNVVGLLRVPGNVGAELIKRVAAAPKDSVVEGEVAWRRLLSTAEAASRGDLGGGIEAHSLAVSSADAATADVRFGRMLKELKDQATANGKTVVLHLVVEGPPSSGRRLQDEDAAAAEDADASSTSSNQKSMYEIQSFNLYLWTSIGLFVVMSMVMSAFIDMPLFPDTLLFGETGAKSGSD